LRNPLTEIKSGTFWSGVDPNEFEGSTVKQDIGKYSTLNILRTVCFTDVKLSKLACCKKYMAFRLMINGLIGCKNILSAQYLENALFDSHRTWYSSTSSERDDPIVSKVNGQTRHRKLSSIQYFENPLFQNLYITS
jgi:hypothetical protein